MLRTIKRRGAALIAGAGLVLSIAACASQAKMQDQPLLNQLMAPNGFVIQQPAQSPEQLNQMDANPTTLFEPVTLGGGAQMTVDHIEKAPAVAPASESQRAVDTKQNTAVHMGCGK
ncbi:MAG: hypothetical protein ACUVWS_12300 [Roseiflexus sp.]